jgi:hypothetical protein
MELVALGPEGSLDFALIGLPQILRILEDLEADAGRRLATYVEIRPAGTMRRARTLTELRALASEEARVWIFSPI